ncbi:MAG: ACT domain-containing protein [Kordiimonadaceae bacterium]|nr:ACT domain-containing protein [Kordiimonadaceae bacterium]
MGTLVNGTFLISIVGRDTVGVVSMVTNFLFETGANLADTSFAVLGEGFEFSCVAEFGDDTSEAEVAEGLQSLSLVKDAAITVTPFSFELLRGATGVITHVVEITGGDRPGLLARISDVLVEYGANIVRMSSHRVAADGGYSYRTRFAVNVQNGRVEAVENALSNTAGSMRLNCAVTAV